MQNTMNKETLKKANKVLASLECAEEILNDMRESLYRYTTIDEDTSKPFISIRKAELVVQERSNYLTGSTESEERYLLNEELTIIIARVIVDYLEKRTNELRKEFENL